MFALQNHTRQKYMKLKNMHILHNISILIFCLIAGCKDNGVDPPPPTITEKKWEVVPEFVNLDIRYMIQFKNELYASVVNYQSDTLYKGAILKTTDGSSWSLVKTFTEVIGPMTVESDSLYVLSDHFIHKMNSQGEWVIKFGLPWEIIYAEFNGDMIFFNKNLYIAQTIFTGYMFKVTPDSVWTKIHPFPGLENGVSCGRFIKAKKNGLETLYLRETALSGNIFHFDGEVVTPLQDGLPIPFEGANSIAVQNDTLFAGFLGVNSGSSGMIMYLDNDNSWNLYRDSLPNSPSAFHYKPPSTTLPTVILFVENRMFIATEEFGVLEWKPDSGWHLLNNGLMLQQVTVMDKDLYNTISFLEYFHGKLFVGYGNPAFMLGTVIAGPRKGLLKYNLD